MKSFALWVEFLKWCKEGKKAVFITPWGRILSPALQAEEIKQAQQDIYEEFDV